MHFYTSLYTYDFMCSQDKRISVYVGCEKISVSYFVCIRGNNDGEISAYFQCRENILASTNLKMTASLK